MLEDRLQNDDRVVDQHADTEGEAAERHDVERSTRAVHQEERGDDRDRNRDSDDQRAARVLEEEEEHQDGDAATEQGVHQHLVDRGANELRLVDTGRQLDALRQIVADVVDPVADRSGDLNGVRVALLVHGELHRLAAAEPADDLTLLAAAGHGGDVGDLDLTTVLAEQDRLHDVFEVLELVVGAHQIARLFLVEAAARLIDVLAQQLLVDVLDGQPEQRELAFVHPNLDLLLIAAVDLDRGHPLGRLEVLLQDLFGDVAELEEIGAAGEVEAHDRVVRRVEPQQQRLGRLARQAQHVELLPHVEGGEVHLASPGELQRHLRQSGPRHRGQALDSGDGADDLFDRPRQQHFDLAGCGAVELGLDCEARVGEVGQQVDRQPAEGDQPEKYEGHRDHRDRDSTAERELDQSHVTGLLSEALGRGRRLCVQYLHR